MPDSGYREFFKIVMIGGRTFRREWHDLGQFTAELLTGAEMGQGSSGAPFHKADELPSWVSAGEETVHPSSHRAE